MEQNITKFSQQFLSNQTAEWRVKYCSYTSISSMISIIKKSRNIESEPLVKHLDLPNITEAQILEQIRIEIEKVSEFYKFKLANYMERFEKLQIMGAFVCKLPSFLETYQNKKPDNVNF